MYRNITLSYLAATYKPYLTTAMHRRYLDKSIYRDYLAGAVKGRHCSAISIYNHYLATV
jgi:hypothetical protein